MGVPGEPCYPKCGLRIQSVGHIWDFAKIQNLRFFPTLLNANLHFNKIPSWRSTYLVNAIQYERHDANEDLGTLGIP